MKRRKSLLKGIAVEAVDLKDKPVNPAVFDALRKMKPARQAEAYRLMVSASTYSSSYARALLTASADTDLVRPRRRPAPPIVTSADLTLMEQELKAARENFRSVETTYGNDMINLAIATRYVAAILDRPKIAQFLDENHPEILSELRSILSATSTRGPRDKLLESDPHRGNPKRAPASPVFVPSRGRKWQRSPTTEDPDARR